MNEIVKVDPKEFGLEEKNVKDIEQAFLPKIVEREALISVYDNILTKELTYETSSEAKEIRLKLVKVRTGIALIHKTQKAYFLAAGKFIDAWKNKETEPVIQMEENLMKIEKHFELIEKERIEKLNQERLTEIQKYSEKPELVNSNGWGNMEQSNYDLLIKGLKVQHKELIEAEKKAEELRIETERLNKLEDERRFELAPYAQFITSNNDLRSMSVVEYATLLASLKTAKKEYEAEQEKIRLENERLKKEAEERENKRLAEEKARKDKEAKEKKERELEQENQRKINDAKLQAEKDKAAKIQKNLELEAEKTSKRNKELQPYIIFIRDYNKMLKLSDVEYNKEFSDIKKGAQDHWEYDKKEAEKKAEKERITKDKNKKIADQLKAREEAEEKARKDEAAKIQAELSKGDAAKVQDLIADLESLKTKYSFKSAKNQNKYKRVGLLIDKVIQDINS